MDGEEGCHTLQRDHEQLGKEWLMAFNLVKCEVLQFGYQASVGTSG